MTPALPDIMMGQALSLATPMPPEASGDYLAGQMGLMVMLATLAAQEAERGIAARVWENSALRSLFGKAAHTYDGVLEGRLAKAAAGGNADLAWRALDGANAELRRVLIALHEAVEQRRDWAIDHEILKLYREMSRQRRLEFPGA